MRFQKPIMLLACSLALVACSKPDGSRANVQGGQQGPEWTLSLKSTCTDGTTEGCLGYYGFAVDAASKYTVGADLRGHGARTRALAVDEQLALEPLVKPVLAAMRAATGVAESCAAREEAPESVLQEHTLTIELQGRSATLARSTVQESCTGLLEAEQIQPLLEKVLELAQSHYPTPYPDKCLDEIDAFEAQYAGLQQCSAATDCAYVGEQHDVIPYDSEQSVFLDDYSKLIPIVVGNASKVTAFREQLNEGREKVKESCGDAYWRDPIPISFRQFISNAGAPLCEQNACKVNPAVFAARR